MRNAKFNVLMISFIIALMDRLSGKAFDVSKLQRTVH